MKRIFIKMSVIIMTILTVVSSTSISLFADELTNHEYIDFSSDRSTWFFRLEGGENNVVFSDFYSPYDSTLKVEAYDPLSMYSLDEEYYFDSSDNLMMNIKDLKKLYDPYFDYFVSNDVLTIRHTVYDKVITDGFGERSTTLEYTKKVWDLSVNINKESKKNSGTYNYTEYETTTGGRNKPAISETEVNLEKSTTNTQFTFDNSSIEVKDGNYYVPLASIMKLMGKVAIEEEGYLAIQQKDLADVTYEVERSIEIAEVVIPSASNVWRSGNVEEDDKNYTWANYMNDVADGKRITGWLWRTFYIPSGSNFKDGDGNEITLDANRIVSFNIYVPTSYDKDETRLTYMLHGGTGNENTPTYRTMARNQNLDEYAEEYNYIIVSPNGWTQNPIWRENQALYSFEKSFEMVMDEFPVSEDKIFIAGNSLGGRGVLELAVRFPNRFNAIISSAPKIADRSDTGKGTVISIEDTKYDLSDIKDMPTMIIQGTADSTTSYKTQIGNNSSKGSITKAIMPKLNNATYLTVEKGSHSYAYGSVLTSMFDFFESNIKTNEKENNFKKLNLKEKSKIALLDDEKYKLSNTTKVVDGVTMISLSDLKGIYGDDFKVYSVNSYDSNPRLSTDYYSIIYNNQTINLTVNNTVYRKNMERYKEDANILKSGSRSDESELDESPQFSVAPYEDKGEVYVPAKEILNIFDLEVSISENNMNKQAIAIGLLVLAIAIGGIYKLKINKK